MAPIEWRAEAGSVDVLQLYNTDPAISWFNSKPRVGQLVYQVITLETQGREGVEQIRLVASKSQMITCFTGWEYFDHCMGGTVFTKVVVPDTPVYFEALRSVRKDRGVLFGHLWKPARRQLPNLATAANCWSECYTNTTGTCRAPGIVPGAAIDMSMLHTAMARRVSRTQAAMGDRDPEADEICQVYLGYRGL